MPESRFFPHQYNPGRNSRRMVIMKRFMPVSIVIVASIVAAAVSANAALIMQLKFTETSGTTAVDSSGNGNNGTLFNTPTDNSAWTGGALALNGVGSHVEVANPDAFKYTGGNLTMSTWINMKSATPGKIFSKPWNAAGEYNYFLDVIGGQSYLFMQGNIVKDAMPATIISVGEWHQVALVLSPQHWEIYLDGGSIGSGANTITAWDNTNTNRSLCIGTLYPWGVDATSSFNGMVSDAQFYNDALTATEVKYLYDNKYATIPEPASMVLLLAGLLGVCGHARRSQARAGGGTVVVSPNGAAVK